MAETHELGGSSLVVDLATPKEIDTRKPSRMSQEGYGACNAYINAATRYAVFGAPTLYDHPSAFGRGIFGIPRGMGRKIFVGRLPQEASADDLRQYFGRFGRIADAYVPKVAIDSATPLDDVGGNTDFADAAAAYSGYGLTASSSGRFHRSLDFVDVSIYNLIDSIGYTK
ncbi:hypothetical protein KSP40_PGU013788 [Platanthera guangdongensis]|uniref:RRM domain-containing protein n=1 Tax=Platanthera guangdongensis TaxID=2320717 RepID=A0ABR2MPZ5_9ASPA